jgi:16S rRNA (cytidine1402-2'-O)-methyltransferase
MKGKLYLIPSMIGDTAFDEVIPLYIREVINKIRHYIVEDERTARRTLIKLGIETPIDDLQFYLMNKHTDQTDIPGYLAVAGNENIGLLSEAGVPAIADPGKDIVLMAHQRKIEVVPLVGPSSILLAMMASGLNGQNFAFNGYLPVKSHERVKSIKHLEQRSRTENQSQLFIEAPYRNNQLVKDLITVCAASTKLCLATDITSSTADIRTQTIGEWKRELPDLNKRPTIFIIHSAE